MRKRIFLLISLYCTLLHAGAQASELSPGPKSPQLFTGKRISLHFQNISIRAVLQILAKFTGMNIIVSDAVDGNITLQLNNVPWDQALDMILTTKGYAKHQVNNVILIDIATTIMARKKQAIEAQQATQKLAPLHTQALQINHAKAGDIASLFKSQTSSVLSERGTVSVDTRTNTIWLQDTAANMAIMQKMVKKLDVPAQQVLIEARLVTMTKDCALDLGVRFGISKFPHISGTLAELGSTAHNPEASIPDHLNVDLRALPIDATPASVSVALANLGRGILLDLELSAMESEGRAEIIASPRLMVVNQQTAMIEAGEDIPYQEATAAGATTVAFKKAVLRLKVTPQIAPHGKLLMDLQINQDSDSGHRVQGVPIISTKAMSTNVLVNNGETIVLGGIQRLDKNNTVSRVPILGDIPVVGVLFRRTQVRTKNEVLLIFITPRIIQDRSLNPREF